MTKSSDNMFIEDYFTDTKHNLSQPSIKHKNN